MRTSGRPSASTVASAIALGSEGSLLQASANHSANKVNGFSDSVKSPDVKSVGCLMEVVSVMSRSPRCIRPRLREGPRTAWLYIGHGDALAYRRSHPRARPWV